MTDALRLIVASSLVDRRQLSDAPLSWQRTWRNIGATHQTIASNARLVQLSGDASHKTQRAHTIEPTTTRLIVTKVSDRVANQIDDAALAKVTRSTRLVAQRCNVVVMATPAGGWPRRTLTGHRACVGRV